MSRGDLVYGGLIVGCFAGGIALLAGVVYVIVSVAKWTWES